MLGSQGRVRGVGRLTGLAGLTATGWALTDFAGLAEFLGAFEGFLPPSLDSLDSRLVNYLQHAGSGPPSIPETAQEHARPKHKGQLYPSNLIGLESGNVLKAKSSQERARAKRMRNFGTGSRTRVKNKILRLWP